VFVVTRTSSVEAITRRVAGRPWIEVVDAGEPVSLKRALRDLRTRGIEIVSCVGGRVTATALLKERLISDIYLTTSAISAGQPDSPYYEGPPLPLSRVLLKEGRGAETGVRFEHFVVESAFRRIL
jgi:riboflavin biosynthesis pyrimidine reductase